MFHHACFCHPTVGNFYVSPYMCDKLVGKSYGCTFFIIAFAGTYFCGEEYVKLKIGKNVFFLTENKEIFKALKCP